MKNVLLGLALLAAVGSAAAAQSSILDDYRFFQSLYPRAEGSEGEGRAFEYIIRRLEEMGLSWERYDASESDTVHTFSSLLEVVVPGEIADTLILAVPVDHSPDDPPELAGAVNLALALSLLDRARLSRPPVSLRVLFLGAEHGPGEEYPLGSRLFLRDFYPEYLVMVLYLNLRDLPSRLIIRSAGMRVAAPYWLIEQATEALESAGLFFLVRGNENQIFRIGLTSERTIIEPYLQAGYPALSLEGEYSRAPQAERWLESFHLFFSRFTGGFARGIPESWDRHYLFFQARSFYLIVDEKTYLILLLATLTIACLYAVAFTGRVKKYARTIGRRLWTLPAIFLLGFGVLFLSTWILERILSLRRMRMLWAELPLLFLVFKLSLAPLLLLLLRRLLRRLPFSRNGSFYSAAAIVFLLLDILILGILNISFTYYFLWAFLFALLFAVASSKPLKVLFFLASPYWLLKTLVELFALPRLEFCQFILLSPVWGNLLLATTLLPFVLMLIRIEMILPSFTRLRKKVRFRLAGSILTLFLGCLLLSFLLFEPYNELNRQPVSVENTVDYPSGTSSLALASPAPLGRMQVLENGRVVPIETDSAGCQLSLSALPPPPRIQVSSTGFLDRKNLIVQFQPQRRPQAVRVHLSGPKAFVLFDANFPYTRSPEGREYDILIGRNPPIPLSLELTLPRGGDFELEIILEYPGLPEQLEVRGENVRLDARQTMRETMALKT
jgi:hypothetical protein